MNIIVSIEEGLGNAIQAMPLIMALSKVAEVDVVCTNRTVEFFMNEGIRKTVRQVYLYADFTPTKHYDYAVVAQWSSGSSVRIVSPYSDKVIFNPHPNWKTESESQCNLDLAQIIGIYAKVEDFPVTFQGIENPIPYNFKMVAFHIGCFNSPVWATRKWPVEHWAKLIEMLYNEDYTPVIISEDSDNTDFDKIMWETKHLPQINFRNRTLQSVAGAIKQCGFLISLDSGIMHLAGTQGIPQISLWGCTSEIKSKPLNPLNHILRNEDIPCKRCYINDRNLWLSCRDNKCMRAITPERVFQTFKEIKK